MRRRPVHDELPQKRIIVRRVQRREPRRPARLRLAAAVSSQSSEAQISGAASREHQRAKLAHGQGVPRLHEVAHELVRREAPLERRRSLRAEDARHDLGDLHE